MATSDGADEARLIDETLGEHALGLWNHYQPRGTPSAERDEQYRQAFTLPATVAVTVALWPSCARAGSRHPIATANPNAAPGRCCREQTSLNALRCENALKARVECTLRYKER